MKKLTIQLICSNKKNPDFQCSDTIRTALQQMGHQILYADDPDDLQIDRPVDLVLVCNAINISPRSIASVNCPRAFWFFHHSKNPASLATLQQCTQGYAERIPDFDFVFVSDRDHIQFFRNLGADPVILLPVKSPVIRQLHQLIEKTGVDASRVWPGFSMGIPMNREGEKTLSLDQYYHTVRSFLIQNKSFASSGRNEKSLRIYCAFSKVSAPSFLTALNRFGEVIDFGQKQYQQNKQAVSNDKGFHFEEQLLADIQTEHQQNTLNMFISDLPENRISPQTVSKITGMGIPAVTICLKNEIPGLQPACECPAAPFTLCWTNSHKTAAGYQEAGVSVLYMPPGADPKIFHPTHADHAIDIAFIGPKQGQHAKLVEFLLDKRLQIEPYGKGWENNDISLQKRVSLYRQSRIFLGAGAAEKFEENFSIRAVDFEVPMCGGLYFTRFNPELRSCFDLDSEIICYSDWVELADKIQFFLNHPQAAEKVRKAGRKRCLSDHTWEQRFQKVLQTLGLLKSK